MAAAEKELTCLARHEDRVAVLIIDDSPADREFYARCLRGDGFDVLTASSGEEGRRKLGQRPVDCVLLDYFLPKDSGIDILNAMRIDPSQPPVPVVMMTGAGSEEVAVNAWRSGAADYLSKDAITEEALKRSVLNAVEKSRLRQTIAEHAAELEQMNKQLRRRNEEVKRFYQTISHELNTPLAAAKECVSVVRDGIAGPLNGEQKEYLDDALDSHEQLAGHLKDLIEATRLDNGKLKIRPRPVQLAGLIRRSLAANAELARERDVVITTEVPDGLPKVFADKDRLVQVLCNLLSNAIKHSQASHAVVLRAAQYDDKVMIEVVDKGCGIEPMHHTGIFERLFQLPNPNSHNDGLGLGLSIAQEIIRLHGSVILVQSEPGEGSNFSFELSVAGPSFKEDN